MHPTTKYRVPRELRHLEERAFSQSVMRIVRRSLIVAGTLLLFGTVAAVAVVPFAPDPFEIRPEDHQVHVQDLPLPDLSEQLALMQQRSHFYVREEAVRSGDTIAALLARLQVQDTEVQRLLMQDARARSALQLRPGRSVQVQADEQGRVVWLRYAAPVVNDDAASSTDTAPFSRVLTIRRALGIDSPLTVQDELVKGEARTEIRSGTIRNSLYGATDDAGIPDAVANQMAEILSGDIDFHRDLRKGDSFRVVYESYYQNLNGEDMKSGRVLALEFFVNKKRYQAVRFGNDYYSEDGKSLRKAFLRSPMPFTRITSGFAMRLHPIHKTWRAHKGVDYGAPSGTPIRAVADGVVEFAGVKGGYGNVVVIRHNGVNSTLYGHMSRFGSGIRKGAHVTQSQVIGYVGQTGWATGPHLHYEFLINGQQRNPLTIALPAAQPLAPQQMGSFRQTFETLRKKLELVTTESSNRS